MEENVLFNPGKDQTANTNQQVPQVPPSPPVLPQSTLPPLPPKTAPVATPPSTPPPIGPTHGTLGLFLKIGAVLLVLAIVGFIIFRFVLPILSGGDSNKKVTLTYWGLWETDNTMQTIIEDFEKEHQNIKVKYEKRDIRKYRQTLQARITNGDGPDIFLFHNSWTPVITGLLSPVSSAVMTPEEFEKVYYPVIQKDLTVKGAIYGIPMGMDTLALFVNDAIFQETGAKVPQTWEEFTNVATGVTVKDGENQIKTYGSGFGAYDNVNRASEVMSLLFLQNRVNLKKPDTNVQSMEEALRFYTDFVTGEDNIVPVWDIQAPSSVIAFAGGNVGMYFGYSWDVFTINNLNPQLSFTIHPVPKLQNNVTVASYWVNGVSSKSVNQEAAQEFLAYLAKKETQEKLYSETSKVRKFGLPPARRDMAAMVQDNPLVYPFIEQAENADSTYFVSDTFDDGLNDQMNSYLGNAIRSVIGNTSIESATETLVSGMNEVLGQYGIK